MFCTYKPLMLTGYAACCFDNETCCVHIAIDRVVFDIALMGKRLSQVLCVLVECVSGIAEYQNVLLTAVYAITCASMIAVVAVYMLMLLPCCFVARLALSLLM